MHRSIGGEDDGQDLLRDRGVEEGDNGVVRRLPGGVIGRLDSAVDVSFGAEFADKNKKEFPLEKNKKEFPLSGVVWWVEYEAERDVFFDVDNGESRRLRSNNVAHGGVVDVRAQDGRTGGRRRGPRLEPI